MPWTAPANATTPGKRTAAGSKERAPSALPNALSLAQGARRPIDIQSETKDPRTRSTGYGGLSSKAFSKPQALLKGMLGCRELARTHLLAVGAGGVLHDLADLRELLHEARHAALTQAHHVLPDQHLAGRHI